MININELEKYENKTFFELNPNVTSDKLSNSNNFLYYNITKPKQFEKLELIFQKKKILAGKYLKEYFETYEFSCNDDEFVSIFSENKDNNKNISLVVSPFIEAKKTTYIPLNEWVNIKEKYKNLKNRYSPLLNEYQVKDHIDLDNVLSIRIPYTYLINTKGYNEASNLMNTIMILMIDNNIELPIIDSLNNYLLAKTINLDNKVLKKDLK